MSVSISLRHGMSLTRLMIRGRESCSTCRNVLAIIQSTPAATMTQTRHILSQAVTRRVQAMTERHDEVVEKLNEGSGDIASLGKEMSSLAQVASLAQRMSLLENEVESLKELLSEAEAAKDTELMEECQKELEELEETRKELEKRVLYAILPRDADDYGCDAVLEIRAGTGGDEVGACQNEKFSTFVEFMN